MDKELVWYRAEIEKRFANSTYKDYVLPRTIKKNARRVSKIGIYDGKTASLDNQASHDPKEKCFSFYKTS